MIHDWYKTEAHMGTAYGCADLMSCFWMGDDKMETYLAQWDHIVDNLEDGVDVPEKALRDMLFKHLQQSTALKEDIAHYKRVGRGGA